ncbi:MAG: metallophosphatase family protein [Acetatifactor sp.]|nr:metallophosphatase family protein [Acetatifactor sp.]
MGKKYLILSDIHGNMSAFDAVMSDCGNEIFDGIILLGDCIDYGMRSNEVIRKLQELESGLWKGKILVNIWGNHEKLAIDKDLERLSSDRGRAMAIYTEQRLTKSSFEYMKNRMNLNGYEEFMLDGLKALAIHGSREDCYWKAIMPDNLKGDYSSFDLVFSGHSHYSHCFTKFYDVRNVELRNKKAVIFINPGSVGQPRNQNPRAQYAVLHLPSKRAELRAVEYDVEYEQSLFPDEIDEFYKSRLKSGI